MEKIFVGVWSWCTGCLCGHTLQVTAAYSPLSRSSGRIGYSSYSSVWKRSSSSANALDNSGQAQTIEQLWQEYFADPFQWWDIRVDKRNPKSPDFSHKVTWRALWIGGWSTPAWVKAKIKSVTEGRLLSHAGSGTRDSQTTAQRNRTIEVRRIGRGGGGNMDMLSASSTNEAIAALKNRLQQGIIIDSYMYAEVLKRCLKPGDLTAVKKIHDCIVKSEMEQNSYVVNKLLSAYVRCGRLPDARQVFDGLVKKNVYSWTVMIGGYAQHNHAKDAMELFDQMRQEGEQPNEITYLSLLKACVSPSALKRGREVHGHIRHGGLETDVRVETAVLQMYAKCGCIKEARQVFEKLSNHSIISWNAMIGAYAESGLGAEAYRLFFQMTRDGVRSNVITYMSILNAGASVGALEWVKEVHSHALKAGMESDLRVGSAFVHMYAKSGSIDDARRVFDSMKERNVITWNVMIGAYAECGRGAEAYKLFLQMKREGFKPDPFTFVSVLNACASEGALEWVKEVHSHALEAGLKSDLRVGSALVHMYARNGSIDDARRVFDSMEERHVITWNIMIGALAQHGCGHEALEVFRRMIAGGLKPNESSFVAVLSACSHAGLLGDGRRLFSTMTQEYDIEPTVVHHNCMVDLLGRAGCLEEAKLFIGNMPVDPDATTWGALLGACRTYGNVELGELAANEVLKLNPEDASAYVLLSNIYAGAGK